MTSNYANTTTRTELQTRKYDIQIIASIQPHSSILTSLIFLFCNSTEIALVREIAV